MKVAIILDPRFDGDPTADAVWLVDSPTNRAWFDANLNRLDANSAIFDGGRYATQVAAVIDIMDDVHLHHPRWTAVEVVGAALTPTLVAELQEVGVLSPQEAGFRIVRR